MESKTLALLIIFMILCSANTSIEGRKNGISELTYDSFHNNKVKVDINNSNISKESYPYLFNQEILFTENCGQIENAEIFYYTQNNRIWFTNDGIWYDLRKEVKTNNAVSNDYSNPLTKSDHYENIKYQRLIIKQEFVGINNVIPKGSHRLDRYSNFFYGNNSENWKIKVPIYNEIFYRNLYDNIDLRIYSTGNGIKYDLIVRPGADLQQIKIRFKGVDKLEIDELNYINVETPFGKLFERNLYIYQNYENGQHHLEGKFVLYDNFEYGFELLQEYKKNEPLIIDPEIRLESSTYFGGIGADIGYDIDSDSMGNVYLTGLTYSSTFPTTPGVNDTIFNGPADAYVFKLNAFMSKLIYSTFIGGNSIEYGQGISVDNSGNVFVTGYTTSADFPTTTNAYDTTHNGNEDVFILKLNSNGTKLIYSTLIGGTDHDRGLGITIDTSGNAYVTGRTKSINFPVTSGLSYIGGIDIILVKLNSNGSSLIFSRVLGGKALDTAEDIEIDNMQNVFITGSTQSNDFNTTPGVFDTTWNGNYDAYVIKMNSSGLSMDYSTYLGGSNGDSGNAIDIDVKGNAVITGMTLSSDFPKTPGVIDQTYNSMYDVFICKLDQKGINLIFSTYLNGSNQDYGYDIAIDSLGYIHVIGQTYSSDFITTSDAFNKSIAGSADIFFMKCDPNATSVIYSTYLGGTGNELPLGMALGSSGQVFITGGTTSTDFPISAGVINITNNGGNDIFVVKFTTRTILEIDFLSIFKDSMPVKTIYSKLCPYTFSIGITDTVEMSDLDVVKLVLDPQYTNVQFILNLTTGKFQKINDPNDYVILEPTSKFKNNIYWWAIDFNLTYNWTYPNENLQDVEIFAFSKTLPFINDTKKGIYQVENDLEFIGSLEVKGEDNRLIHENSLVRGKEKLSWTNLTVVYENTKDIFPLETEFDVTVLDELGSFWTTSPKSGETFYVETITPDITCNTSFAYTVKISEIPSISDISDGTFSLILSRIPDNNDHSNETFNILIDATNVSFSNPTPPETIWQTQKDIPVGITITDEGGGEVNTNTTMYKFSTNNGISWNDWKLVSGLESKKTVEAIEYIKFQEGTGNLVKWRALDSLGNGPNESMNYRILIDTESISFSNFQPLATDVSPTEEVAINITISDANSGVDASTIEYAISNDRGTSWNDWQPVKGYENGTKVVVSLNLTFPNGTDNVIKWCARDIAGNGPTESHYFVVLVNTWVPTIKPKVTLLSPYKGSKINETSITLQWMIEKINAKNNSNNITYDLYFGNKTPVEIYIRNITDTSFHIDGLVDGGEYYWYVIPKQDGIFGICDSGVWWFEIELDKDIQLFELDISGPNSVSLYPGENKSLEFTVVNLGNKDDTIRITIDSKELANSTSFRDLSMIHLKSKQYSQRTLDINISNNTPPGFYQIIITAISINSGELEKDIQILTIEIKEPILPKPIPVNDNGTKNGTERESLSLDLLIFTLITLIIIIILISALVYVIIKRKRDLEKDLLLPGGTYAVKPGTLPSPTITLDQISAPESGAELPSSTTITSPQSIAVSNFRPALVKSTMAPTKPIQQLAQLPPAKIYDMESNENQRSIEIQPPTPTVAQSTVPEQGLTVHLPDDTPQIPQPSSPIAKPVASIIQQPEPSTEQTMTQPLAQQQEPNVIKEEIQGTETINQSEKITFSTPGITPEKIQTPQKKEDEND